MTRKQFRLIAGNVEGRGIFYACETRSNEVIWGQSDRNRLRCVDIPVEISRTYGPAMELYDLTDPDRPQIGHLALAPGQQLKIVTESNPPAWGRYDLDSSNAGNLVDIVYQYTAPTTGSGERLVGGSGVDEWIITANNYVGTGSITLEPSFTKPGPWEEMHLPYEIHFTVNYDTMTSGNTPF